MKLKRHNIKKVTTIFSIGLLIIIYTGEANSYQESLNQKYALSNRNNECNDIISINEMIFKNKVKWKANYTSVIDKLTGDIKINLGCINEEGGFKNSIHYWCI